MTPAEEPTLVHAPDAGDPCAHCGAPLAGDQRYCLNCGTRHAERRVPAPLPAASPVAVAAPGVALAPGAVAAQRLGGLWGVAALLLVALAAGVLIGTAGDEPAPVAAAAPAVTVAAAPTGATSAALPVADGGAAEDEWPDRDGFTVQLGELDGDATQAEADAAKAAAAAKGAEDPGVLDAAAHGLTEGKLVLYSGVYATRKRARAALADLEDAYPDARVIAVKATGGADASAGDDDAAADGDGGSTEAPAKLSDAELKARENLDPEEFQKQSKKLPKTTGTGGAAPATDDGAPGGGGEAESIG